MSICRLPHVAQISRSRIEHGRFAALPGSHLGGATWPRLTFLGSGTGQKCVSSPVDALLDARSREVRVPVDHRFVRSIYLHDPNGYVIELTASTGKHGEIMDPAISKPHEALAHWQAMKSH